MVTLELLERVKAATVPDRLIDADLFFEFDPDFPNGSMQMSAAHDPATFATGAYASVKAPPYTASIDAALGLVERVLPGLVVKASKLGDGTGHWQVQEAWIVDGGEIVSDWEPMDPRPGALAFVEVLLAALIAKEPS